MTPLEKLNPRWLGLLREGSGEGIAFDCPKCGPSHQLAAYFENPIDGKECASWQRPIWKRSGTKDFKHVGLSPSLQYECFHGWVENGRVFDVSESPLVIFGERPDRSVGPISLSPLQAINVAVKAAMEAKQMLGG